MKYKVLFLFLLSFTIFELSFSQGCKENSKEIICEPQNIQTTNSQVLRSKAQAILSKKKSQVLLFLEVEVSREQFKKTGDVELHAEPYNILTNFRRISRYNRNHRLYEQILVGLSEGSLDKILNSESLIFLYDGEIYDFTSLRSHLKRFKEYK